MSTPDKAMKLKDGKIIYDDLRQRVEDLNTTAGTKADKVNSAISGNFAALDSNGNLVDSGHKHSDYLTSFTETDPTVPSWAKAINKPSYTASEVGAPTIQEMTNAISTAIGNIHQFGIEVVQELPTTGIKEHTIYFVSKTGDTNDIYDEYMYLNNNWEIIGSTQVDLTDYALKSEIPNVPTDVSAFTNDAGYLTQHQDISGKANTADLATVAFSGDYDDLQDKPNIPTKVSDLTDDSGHYTKPVGGIPASDLASGVIPTVPVQDVQVNGTSVLSNGVANIPVADSSTFGVIKDSPDGYGVKIGQSGYPYVTSAQSQHIKQGTSNYRPITPTKQHESTFYGLAKAAGDTTQASSDNAVGTYTATAKAAIQTMLGVPSTSDIPTVPVQDVQINGTTILSSGIADITADGTTGVTFSNFEQNGGTYKFGVLPAWQPTIKAGTEQYRPICANNAGVAAFYGLAKAAGDTTQASSDNAVGTYTASAKSAILTMIGADIGVAEETVSGTTPTITAATNTRYICGEVSTISITPCATGSCEIIFTSGTTPAVLTLPNTVKLPDWFDATSLETNRIYDILITNGVYGAVMSWAS